MSRRAAFNDASPIPRLPVAIDARGPGSLIGVFDVAPKDQWTEKQVPVGQLRATQAHVSEEAVRNIAQTPKHVMDKRKKMPRGYEHHDGSVWIEDGHTRTTAALLRGDSTVRVQIRGTVRR